MRKLYFILFVVLFPFNVFSQYDYRARLNAYGRTMELAISPTEELWASIYCDNVYRLKPNAELWDLGDFKPFDSLSPRPSRYFEKIKFFDENTMMVTGFYQDNRENNYVYRTTDKGKTWHKVVFGEKSDINVVHLSASGKVWMAGQSNFIYYSEDKGETWTTFNKVTPTEKLWISALFFDKDEHTGFISSKNGDLFRTKDKGKTWEKLPTPYSQQKFEPLYRSERQDIHKIQSFGDFYIINQKGKIFISKADTIAWTYYPEIASFQVTDTGDLYTINKDCSVSLYDQNLHKKWHKRIIIPLYHSIAVKNNKLFILSSHHLYKISPEEVVVSELFTLSKSIGEVYKMIENSGDTYGFVYNDIYRFDPQRKLWYRLMTANFNIKEASVWENKIILGTAKSPTNYILNPDLKEIKPFDRPADLYAKLKIKALHFERNVYSCVYTTKERRSYKREGNYLRVDYVNGLENYLPNAVSTIYVKDVSRLLNEIAKPSDQPVQLKDFQFSKQDILDYKALINKKENDIKNKRYVSLRSYDFNFYRSVADSLADYTKEITQSFWEASGFISTTRIIYSIIMEFENGKTLTIHNEDLNTVYLHSPWNVEFDGLKYRTIAIPFGHVVDKLSGGEFFAPEARKKQLAIYQVADYVYRNKMNKL